MDCPWIFLDCISYQNMNTQYYNPICVINMHSIVVFVSVT